MSSANFSLFGATDLPLAGCPAACKEVVTIVEGSSCALVTQLNISADMYSAMRDMCDEVDTNDCVALANQAVAQAEECVDSLGTLELFNGSLSMPRPGCPAPCRGCAARCALAARPHFRARLRAPPPRSAELLGALAPRRQCTRHRERDLDLTPEERTARVVEARGARHEQSKLLLELAPLPLVHTQCVVT